MKYLKYALFTLLFSFTIQAAQAQKIVPKDQLTTAEDNLQVEVPSFDYEIVELKTLGFPVMIPAKRLGYHFVLLKDDGYPLDHKVFGANELDQMPLFSSACLKAEDPEACSEEGLSEFLKANIDYPDPALEKEHDGLEKLFFVINEEGKIEGNIKVISKDKPCRGCAQAAVDAVANMPKWVPGKINGQAVKSKIVLPIRFETIQ